MSLFPLVRRAAALSIALAILLEFFAPVIALPDTNIASPNNLPSDLAPDAVAVTDPAAIKAKLDGMTIYGRYYDGENWIEYHLPDGRTAYWEKGCTYPGKWWEQDDQDCYDYPSYG